jgi:hypothetical protein
MLSPLSGNGDENNRDMPHMELKKGNQVTVEAYRAKDRSNVANAGTITSRTAGSYSGASKPPPGPLLNSRAGVEINPRPTLACFKTDGFIFPRNSLLSRVSLNSTKRARGLKLVAS